MFFNKRYVNIQFVLLFIYLFNCTYLIDITFRNNDALDDLSDKINSLSINNEIKIIFKDYYYKFSSRGRYNYNLYNTLIFHSETGSLFDFQDIGKKKFNFFFHQKINNKKLVFRNITFYNYHDNGINTSLFFIDILIDDENYYIEFDNCTFLEIRSTIFQISHSCLEFITSKPQISFNNCIFM